MHILTAFTAYLACVLAVTTAQADVVVYHTKHSPGIRSYTTEFAASGDWNIRCSRQTSGALLGGPDCELTQWNGQTYPRSGIRKDADGLQITLHREKVEIGFAPSKLQDGSSFSVSCGSETFSGQFRRSGRPVAPFEGREGAKLLEALQREPRCSATFTTNGSRARTLTIPTRGLTAAVEHARAYLSP